MLEKSNKKREGFRKTVNGKVAVFFAAFPQKEAVALKKDLHLKRYLSDKRRIADLINGFVSDGREILSADKLAEMGSQSESTRTQKYRDRLYKASFGVNFMVIGIEGQEQTHYLMPLRCMTYDSTEYERQATNRRREIRQQKNLSKEEWLSGFTLQDQLNPCITLVLYFGEQWCGATHLHELLNLTDIPAELCELVNDYRIHVLEVQKLTDTTVFHTDLKQVFDAIRFSKDPAKFRKLIFSDPAYRNLDIEAYNVIIQYTHADDRLTLREHYNKGDKIDMCQALTMMLNDERSIGKAVGLREGKASSILILLSEHSVIPESLSERIRSEQDISVLTNWLKLAAKAPTLDDFTKNM